MESQDRFWGKRLFPTCSTSQKTEYSSKKSFSSTSEAFWKVNDTADENYHIMLSTLKFHLLIEEFIPHTERLGLEFTNPQPFFPLPFQAIFLAKKSFYCRFLYNFTNFFYLSRAFNLFPLFRAWNSRAAPWAPLFPHFDDLLFSLLNCS